VVPFAAVSQKKFAHKLRGMVFDFTGDCAAAVDEIAFQ
jgi:hypothetical protein